MGELQALAGLIRECRKTWSSIVDAEELEHWGQLVMDVMAYGLGDPSVEVPLTARSGGISRQSPRVQSSQDSADDSLVNS